MSALVARAAIRDYGEHRVVPSRPAFPSPILLETSTRSPGRYTPPRPIHRFQALLPGHAREAIPLAPGMAPNLIEPESGAASTCRLWVELRGFEPLTPSMRIQCSTGQTGQVTASAQVSGLRTVTI